MSSPTPGPRRRRIAGERRPARPHGAPAPVGSTPAPPVDEPTAPPAGGPPALPVDAPPPAGGSVADRSEEKERRFRFRRPVRTTTTDEPAGWWGSRQSVGLLAGVLVALLVASALLAFGLLGNDSVQDVRRAEDVDRASRSASATAERAAAAVLAYDHRSLDAGKENALRFLADGFAEDYSATFDKVVAPQARETRAVVTAEVQASAVVRASEEKVRVLLFVDQTTKSNANPTPQLALNRVEMIMVREGGSWLVDAVTSY